MRILVLSFILLINFLSYTTQVEAQQEVRIAQNNSAAGKKKSVVLAATSPLPNYTLASSEPYHAVHVPLVIRNGEALVLAKLAGKSIWCQLDSGSSVTTWASWLHLPCQPTGLAVISTDASAAELWSEIVFLPEVELGGYRVRNLVSSRTFTGEREDSPSNSYVHRIPLLSGTAFAPVVYTIDYVHSELIIRDHNYDVTAVARRKDGILLDFTLKQIPLPEIKPELVMTSLDAWEVSQLKYSGIPFIKSIVAGTITSTVLDTGWSGSGIGISEDYFRRNMKDKKWQTQKGKLFILNGSAEFDQISNVPFAFTSGEIFLTSAYIVPLAYSVVGSGILQHYRVTIDYQRRKILLEPNASLTGSDKPVATVPVAPPAIRVGTTVKDGVNYVVWGDGSLTPLLTVPPPPHMVDNDQQWVYYNNIGWSTVPKDTHPLPPLPPRLADTGFHWRYYPNSGWAMVPN